MSRLTRIADSYRARLVIGYVLVAAVFAVGILVLSAGLGLVFSLWVLFVGDVWRLRASPSAAASTPAAP